MSKQSTNLNGLALQSTPRPIRHWCFVVGLLCFGMFLGATMSPSSEAVGEVRAPAQQEAFLSGGQMSVPLLKQIAEILQQMDARLARLEVVAKQMQRDNRAANSH